MANSFLDQILSVTDRIGNATLGKVFPLVNPVQDNYNNLLRSKLYDESGNVNINTVKQLNPSMYQSFERGGIDSGKLAEILLNGNVAAWNKPTASPSEQMGSVLGQYTNNVQPQPTQVTQPTAQPVVQGESIPQDVASNVLKYRYQGKTSKLDSEYLDALWNEVNTQRPDLSNNDKVALFESTIAASFPESHMGADYQNTGRNSNIWNIGYNSSAGSTLKYDPTDKGEMAKKAVQQLVNTFGFIENKGPARDKVFNYVVGPNAPKNSDNWSKVDNWINAYNTGLKVIGATQPWGK